MKPTIAAVLLACVVSVSSRHAAAQNVVHLASPAGFAENNSVPQAPLQLGVIHDGITVIGRGSAAATPDRVVIEFRVTGANDDNAAALTAYRDTRKKFDNAMRAIEGGRSEIRGTGAKVGAPADDGQNDFGQVVVFGGMGGAKEQLEEFRVSEQVFVTLTANGSDLTTLAAAAIDRGMEAGATLATGGSEMAFYSAFAMQGRDNATGPVRFTISNTQPTQQIALASAMQDAKRQSTFARRLTGLAAAEVASIDATHATETIPATGFSTATPNDRELNVRLRSNDGAAGSAHDGIRVVGTAELEVRPDRAVVTFTVSAHDAKAANAMVEFRKARERLSTALARIEGGQVEVGPERPRIGPHADMQAQMMGQQPADPPEIEVSEQVRVSVSGEGLTELVSRVVAAGTGAEATLGKPVNPWMGTPPQTPIRYVADADDAAFQQAVKRAFDDARTRAAMSAKLAGTRLGDLAGFDLSAARVQRAFDSSTPPPQTIRVGARFTIARD